MKETSKFAAPPAQTGFRLWYKITKAIRFPSLSAYFVGKGRLVFPVVLQFFAFSVLFGLAAGCALPFAYLMESLGLTVSAAVRVYFLTVIAFLAVLRIALSPRLKQKIKTALPDSLLSKAVSYIDGLNGFFDKTAKAETVPAASAGSVFAGVKHRLFDRIFKRNRVAPPSAVTSGRGAANDAASIEEPIVQEGTARAEGRRQLARIHSIYFEVEG
jgi:hypothetical protein